MPKFYLLESSLFPFLPNNNNILRNAGNFFPTMCLTSNNESVWFQISKQAALQISFTSEGNSALLPANDQQLTFQRGLMNFHAAINFLKY